MITRASRGSVFVHDPDLLLASHLSEKFGIRYINKIASCFDLHVLIIVLAVTKFASATVPVLLNSFPAGNGVSLKIQFIVTVTDLNIAVASPESDFLVRR